MEYKRIDENTIRCIITEEDMEDFGLNLDEFLSHSKKSEEFLRYIVEEARGELGYQSGQGVISLRLEVLNDGRISLTFVNGDEKMLKEQIMKHLQSIFPDLERGILDRVMNQLAGMSEEERTKKMSKLTEGDESKEDLKRLFCFRTMKDVMDYCRASGLAQPVRSSLYKDQGEYYLLIEKYRISEFRFNALTALAFEYARVIAAPDEIITHLKEYGELLIENKAFGVLRRIG